MFEYVIRRLLLMIPTFFGTTLLVFMILQSVPSGPFEQAVLQIKMAKMPENAQEKHRKCHEMGRESAKIWQNPPRDSSTHQDASGHPKTP